jgi:hypothetical protein
MNNFTFSKRMTFKYCIIILSLVSIQCFAQVDSSSVLFQNKEIKKKSFLLIKHWSDPKKASVLSAILPGAGQVYNKRYWKVPVIYGLEGALIYSIIQQNANYNYYKTELIKVINGGISKDGYSAQQLSLLKNQSKKWRDLSIAGSVLVYVLNIIDANVDAHLKTFDISDNLSFQIKIFPDFPKHPQYSSTTYMLSFHWKIIDK